ncbi:MAG: histidinol-phosphate transaminase [Desulfobacteraceae bacterium]|jgi:histidinol-phosphate aminotransferase|nr:MAG: histidinol-phosphate transaminase [Desulfobacteraceae bacterium]
MRSLIRKGIEELVPYPPGKPIEELERELGVRSPIKLASNENPLGPSPMAVRAIREKLDSLNRYPDGSGYYLKEKLSGKFGVPAAQIILGNGSNEIIELIIRTFLSPGDNVVQAFPTFLVYEKIVKGAGGTMTSVPLVGFRPDLEAMFRAITPSTKIIFLNNPNNPTGALLSQKEVGSFLKSVPRDIIVALDEAYIEFVRDKNAADGVQLLSDNPMLVALRTFSKLYGLAGLRIGYGFSSPKIVDYMNRVRQPFNANLLAQAAATAALDDHEFVQKTLALVHEGLEYLYKALEAMGLEYVPTQTNFFLIRIPGGGKPLYERLLRQGVIVRAMDSFGLPEYIRISVGLPEENRRFIEALGRVLGGF